jgi:hypothetical protein
MFKIQKLYYYTILSSIYITSIYNPVSIHNYTLLILYNKNSLINSSSFLRIGFKDFKVIFSNEV